MKWLVALALIVVGASAACEVMYPTYAHRYRLTVEVDVDGKVHSGSSVIEVSARSQPKLLPDLGARIRLRGDAVYVDLGQAGSLVALLATGPNGTNPDGLNYLAIEAFEVPPPKEPLGQFIAIRNMAGTRQLPPNLLPALATFSNPKNPQTMHSVAPGELGKVLGSGISIKRASIELTDSPVTRGIESRLPWLPELKSKQERSGYYSGSLEPRTTNFTR